MLVATCKVFHAYCAAHGIPLHDRNFTLSYDTNVPRQVSGAEVFDVLRMSLKITDGSDISWGFTFLFGRLVSQDPVRLSVRRCHVCWNSTTLVIL